MNTDKPDWNQYIFAHVGVTKAAGSLTPMDKGECIVMLNQLFSDYVTPLQSKISSLESDRERLLSALKDEKSLLWAWINYSSNGGWSTHLNEFMKRRIEVANKLITEIESKIN